MHRRGHRDGTLDYGADETYEIRRKVRLTRADTSVIETVDHIRMFRSLLGATFGRGF